MTAARRAALPAVLVFLTLCGTAGAARAASIRVEVNGIEGDLRQNVLTALSIVQLAEERRPDPARVRAAHDLATEQIEVALQPFGFYRPRVRARLDMSERKPRAVYDVEPGPRLTVERVEIDVTGAGAGAPQLAELVRQFPLASGDPLLHPEYERGKQAFLDFAAAHGYLDGAFTTAEIRVDRDRYRADIVLVFDTGPQFVFGSLEMRQDILDMDIVAGYAPFRRGDPLDLGRLLQFQNTLSDSGYFARAEVRADHDEAPTRFVPVEVRLEPAPRRRWSGGLGYGTDTGPRVTGQFELHRINRRGHRGEASFTASGIERSLEARYVIPLTPPPTETLTFAIGYADLRPTSSRERLALISSTYARTRGAWQQSIGLSYRRENFEVGSDRGTSGLFVPELVLTRTRADDRVYPTRGHRLDFRVRGAEDALLSDTSFARLQTRAQFVRGIFDNVRVLARADAGIMWAPDFRQLPSTHRFFAGGDQSVRGFDFQAIGDLDETGQVIGGTRLFTASLELDWLFLEKWGRWGLAVFVDAGDAGRSLDLFERRGAGLGIRWLSPVGMVRVDVASAISEPGRPIRLHLSLGPDL